MGYEAFKNEVERVLSLKEEPLTWSEIREISGNLRQKAPYHVYVQKLQGDIGLVRFKPKGRKETVWALREWFERGMFADMLPERMRFIILHVNGETAIASDEHKNLRRVFPIRDDHLSRWDVVDAEISEFFPLDDRRPESIRVGELNFVKHVEKERERVKIAENTSESGEFLHTSAWNGKTLGMTKPRFRCFYFYDDRCQFFCDQRVCLGHDVRAEKPMDRDEMLMKDRVYFIFESKHIGATEDDVIWRNRIEWVLKTVIALEDPRQRRLFCE